MAKTHQEQTIIWMSSATEKERFEYLGKIMDCFKDNELRDVQSKIKCAWKRKFRRINNTVGPSIGPESPVGPVTIEGPKEETGWWTNYQYDEDIIAFDTEHVELLKPDEQGRSKVAGAVTIVNFKNEVIYKKNINHSPYTFKDNVIAGYHTEMGIKVEKFQKVKSEVQEILKGKLIVTCGGVSDYPALDLCISNYDTFDLHNHFRKETTMRTKTGEKVSQPIGLRSLYNEFFKKDIQTGNHSSESDAKATMDIFRRYMDIKAINIGARNAIEEQFEEFQHIQTLRTDFKEAMKQFQREKRKILYDN